MTICDCVSPLRSPVCSSPPAPWPPAGAEPLPPGGTFRDDEGNVHEGAELPDLVGQYFYVDLCREHLSSFELVAGAVTPEADSTGELGTQNGVWSFGSDNAGEIKRLTGV